MKLYEVPDRSQPLLEVLLQIWERSVRATHLFLSDAEVNRIKLILSAINDGGTFLWMLRYLPRCCPIKAFWI